MKNCSYIRKHATASIAAFALAAAVACAVPSFAADEKSTHNNDTQYKLDLAKSFMRQGLAGNPGFFDRAIAKYGEILKDEPKNPEAIADLADTYSLKGDSKRAEALYKDLEKIDASFAAWRKKKMPQPEAAAAPAATGNRPAYVRSVNDMLDTAKSYMRQGLINPAERFYFDKAIAQYEEALKTSPENKEALAGLAETYQRKGDAVKAEEFYKKLAALDPAFSAALKQRIAQDMMPQALPKNAKTATAAALHTDIGYKLDLAKSYMQQGFANPSDSPYFDNALKEYEEILKASPGEKDALKGLATIYAQKGNVDEAERILKQLIKSEPDDLSHHISLGFFYFSKGLKDKALSEIQIVIEKDPKNGRARVLRAVLYEEQGDLPSAIEQYNEAIRIAMDARDAALVAQAMMGLGRLYDKARLYYDAAAQYEALVRILQGYPDASVELARLTFRLGLVDRSIDILTSLLKANPSASQAYTMLGLAYYKKGSYDTALLWLKKAKNAGIDINDRMLAAVEQKAQEFWAKEGKE